MSGRLVLYGTYGILKGQKFLIEAGQTVYIGRSHSCDICLEGISKPSDPDARHEETHFHTISRKHLRISYNSKTNVELEDLSANGTTVDGEKITKITLADVVSEPHVILLGTREKFVLEWEPS